MVELNGFPPKRSQIPCAPRGATRLALVFLAVASLGPSALAQPAGPRFVQKVPGAESGVYIKCDLQHRFADPDLGVTQFVSRAVDGGCQVVFVSPSVPTDNKQALSQFLQEIEGVRAAFPKIIVIPVFAWVVRTQRESAQAMIVLPPGDDHDRRFVELPSQLIRTGAGTSASNAVGQSLRILCPADRPVDEWPVLLFDEAQPGVDLHAWAVEHFTPGDLWSDPKKAQRSIGQFGLLDRWDPAELRSGGDWDKLLAQGWNSWAAAESLEFVRAAGSRTKPGEFTETWLRAADTSPAAVVDAVRRGSFYGVSGGSVRDVKLTVTAAGLSRSAVAGETIDVPAGTPLKLQLSLTVPENDFRGMPHRLDGVELIRVTSSDSDIVVKDQPSAGRHVLTYELDAPDGGVLFRAVGYRVVKDGANYGFYTNPIRVVVGGQWNRPAPARAATRLLPEAHLFVVFGLLVVLSALAVGGYLASTGKLVLLFGDSLDPFIELWKTSDLRQNLRDLFPSRGRRQQHRAKQVIGTALSVSECRWLTSALIGLGTMLGVVAGGFGWPSAWSIPGIPTGTITGVICGFVIGTAVAAASRWQAGIAFWTFMTLRIVAAQSAEKSLLAFVPAALALAWMATVVREPLRSGAVFWPADAPLSGLLGLFLAVGLSAIVAIVFPGVAGDIALLLACSAIFVWRLANSRSSATWRTLAVAIVAVLWFGGLLWSTPQTGEIPSWGMILHALAESVGIATLLAASLPQRTDVFGASLSQAALAIVLSLGFAEPVASGSPLLTAAAFLGIAAVFLNEPAFPWKLSGAIAAAALGRLLLFSPEQAGSWLVGGVVCLVFSVTSRHPVRTTWFVLPYVLAGGLWAIRQSVEGGWRQVDDEGFVTLLQHEFAALKAICPDPARAMNIAGEFAVLFCLTALSVLYWPLRARTHGDVFDGLGRLIWASLLLCVFAFACQLRWTTSSLIAWMSLIGLWAANLPPTAWAARPSSDSLTLEDRNWNRWRLFLGCAAVVVAGLIAYGSLVPFQWREVSWHQAVHDFWRQTQFQQMWRRVSSDRLVNLFLTVPLGFCLYGSMVLGRRGIAPRLWAVFEAWQASCFVSVLVEISQYWSAKRVASVDDVVAQAIGALVGIVVWVLVGERIVGRLAATHSHDGEARWTQLLWPYLLGMLVFAVMPAGLPVTSPKQLYAHFRDGRLSVLPFADSPTWPDVAHDFIVGVLMFVPIGLWSAAAFRKPGTPLRSLWAATALGTAFAALVMTVRALCSVKQTDSSWLLTGLLGSVLGAELLRYSVYTAANRRANWKAGVAWWATSFIYAALVAAHFLHPWVFDAAPEQIAAGWKTFLGTPFAGFHSGDDWQLIDQVLRKLAWFAALGVLLGHAVCRTSELRAVRVIGVVCALLLAAGVSLGIEVGQLHQTARTPEFTDVLIYFVGACLGLWLRMAWIESSRSEGAFTLPANAPPTLTAASLLQTALALGVALLLFAGLALVFLRR